jgi:hypothetical protein
LDNKERRIGMTDKVQKIKDWISKKQDGLMDAQGNFEYPEHEGAYHILCNLDTYIDSLQEEPTIPDIVDEHYWEMLGEEPQAPVSEELEKIVEEITEPTVLNAYGTKELARRLCNTVIYGTSVSKELEEEIENYVKRNGYDGLDSIEEVKYIANHFTNWQKLQDMGITNNRAQDVVANVLSSADNPLDAYATEVAFMMLPATLKESYHQTNRDRIGDAVKLGAKWQEEKDDEEKVLTYKHGFNDCKEHINEVLLSEVLPCFMHGGEADEVVAKLDEVLNQKK